MSHDVQKIIDNSNGFVQLENRTYHCAEDILVSRPIVLQGCPSTKLLFAPNKGLRFENASKSTVKQLKIAGTGTHGQLLGIGTNGNSCAKILFEQVEVDGGFRNMWIQKSLSLLFIRCTFKDATGSEVVKFAGGPDSTHGVDNAEFLSCNFGSHENPQATVLLMDGKVHGVKFINCPFLFGMHGIVLDRSNPNWQKPKCISIIGGGFENSFGNGLRLLHGDDIRLDTMYLSTDGKMDGIYMASAFEGRLKVANSIIRGNGRDGIRAAGGRLTVTGCDIINNGGRTTGDGIRLENNARDFVITGNFLGEGPDGTNKQRYGLVNNVGSEHGWVYGNRFRGNIKAAFGGSKSNSEYFAGNQRV